MACPNRRIWFRAMYGHDNLNEALLVGESVMWPVGEWESIVSFPNEGDWVTATVDVLFCYQVIQITVLKPSENHPRTIPVMYVLLHRFILRDRPYFRRETRVPIFRAIKPMASPNRVKPSSDRVRTRVLFVVQSLHCVLGRSPRHEWLIAICWRCGWCDF